MENLSPYLPPLSKVFSKQTSEDNMDTMHNTSNSEESAQTESARKSASGSKKSTQQIASGSGSTEDSEHLRDPNFLSNFVSLFNPRDRRSLNVTFRPARRVAEVIPTYLNVNIPQEAKAYILPEIKRSDLEKLHLNINELSNDNIIKAFIYKLHQAVINSELKVDTAETFTDALVTHLIFRTVNFDQWPMVIELRPKLEFTVGSATLIARPEFVIFLGKYAVLVIEDRHIKNVKLNYEYGESQIAGEIIACGNENLRIARKYWYELAAGCPRRQSISVDRYPGDDSDPLNGFDLATSEGREAVINALCKIRERIRT
uniref:Uncharacterized protein n=1 Tax=Rhizophagus irregularis (strain DAOM 181602 / DAOM 197198 / MUCL 43194) TaxID=747089 RepID=U9U9I7_RHIID